MTACALSPEDQRVQARTVGNDLVQHYGKKKFYDVDEVKAANRRQNISLDVGCWSHAMFNTRADFDAYHRSIGEACDYTAMRSEMLESLTSVDPAPLIEADGSWLDLPDLLSIFDFLDF